MNEFKLYVNKLLKKTNFNSLEREDLENELVEHLNNLKYDYLKKGFSEKDAIDTVIKNFNSSDFLNEMNNFSKKQKLSGFSIKFTFKTTLILSLIYIMLTISIFTLFKVNRDSNLLYSFVICLISFLNYYYSASNFIFKKDITLNILITCFSFFLLEKITSIIFANIYVLLTYNIKFNILDLFSFDFNKIIIYILISIIFLFISLFSKISIPKTNSKLNNIDISILISSVLLNIIYYFYPNRFYFLNLIISDFFNINIDSLDKNLLYMNINNEIVIINIGLLLLLFFIGYKSISYLYHIYSKNKQNV